MYYNEYGKGKSGDNKEDSVDASWSRPRRERYVTDIPPETMEERWDRSVWWVSEAGIYCFAQGEV
jgi:hypothetical protein